MKTVEAWIAPRTGLMHEVEVDPQTVAAFWRLGRVLTSGEPRDREVFALGRCIGSTPGTTATLAAFGERDDPASFAMSKLMYGGDQTMLDAYWSDREEPLVFRLAREVHRWSPRSLDDPQTVGPGGAVIFDVSAERARLIGLRFAVE